MFSHPLPSLGLARLVAKALVSLKEGRGCVKHRVSLLVVEEEGGGERRGEREGGKALEGEKNLIVIVVL